MTWLLQAPRDLRLIRISPAKDAVPMCRSAAAYRRLHRFNVGWRRPPEAVCPASAWEAFRATVIALGSVGGGDVGTAVAPTAEGMLSSGEVHSSAVRTGHAAGLGKTKQDFLVEVRGGRAPKPCRFRGL